MESALDEKELDEIKDKQDAVTAKFHKKEIPYEEFVKEMSKLDELGGAIKTKELIELMDILRGIGLSKEQIEALVSHENDHCAKAISLGMDPLYQVQLFKIGEMGRFGLYTSVRFEMPKDMPDDEKSRAIKEITNAVEELSHRDKSQLR